MLKIHERDKFTSKLGYFDIEQTITYKPQINVDIPPEKLAFNPPEK